MSKLKHLVIHCTDTPEGRWVSSQDIRAWHTDPRPKGRGWSQVGYCKMVHLDGTVEELVTVDDNNIIEPWEVTNGARGYNSSSKHIVYVGGGQGEDTRTQEQLIALQNIVLDEIIKHPDIIVMGHNQISDKDCPSFDVPFFCEMINLPEKNIYRG